MLDTHSRRLVRYLVAVGASMRWGLVDLDQVFNSVDKVAVSGSGAQAGLLAWIAHR